MLDGTVADPEVVATALLLPKLTKLEKLAATALEMAKFKHWIVTTSALKGTPEGDMVAVHITRMIPFGEAECPSEALVLGPFDNFPRTRKAPVTAIEMFVGEPRPLDPKSGNPTTKANVAHMDMGVLPDIWAIMWEESEKGRLASLGGINDPRAKAKVAFPIPLALAKQLGCEP